MLRTLTFGLAGLMLAACATPIESNAPLLDARQAVTLAEASGVASTNELNTARDYLTRTEEAFEANDADVFVANASLTEAYADLAVARGELGGLRGDMDEMSGALSSAEEAAGVCRVELESAESRLQECAGHMGAEVAALAEALGAFSMEQTSDGVRITLRNVGFELESAGVNGESRKKLAALADYLASHSDMAVRIHGHTDSTGPETYNMRLSEQRAQAVASILTDGGVAGSRVETAGMGETAPAVSNDTRAGRIANRRVEVTLIAPSADA